MDGGNRGERPMALTTQMPTGATKNGAATPPTGLPAEQLYTWLEWVQDDLRRNAIRLEVSGAALPGQDEQEAAAAARAEGFQQAELLREFFGNPFRPALLDPCWLHWNDDCVVRLARAIYDEMRFEDLPILGDALEEAGCGLPAVLEHCRTRRSHARGCWLVDQILGND